MIEKITKDKGGFKSRPVHHARTPYICDGRVFGVLWDLKNRGYYKRTLKGIAKN